MRKIFYFLILLFIANNIHAQRTWFNPQQRATIDSLFQIVDTLGLSGFSSLAYGKFYIGSASGVATARTISGDFTINYLGVGAIGSGKVTNTMLSTGIDVSKFASGTVNNTKWGYLANLTSDVQTQINNINVGTGYLLAAGDEIEGDLTAQDDIIIGAGDDQDLAMYYDSGNNQSVIVSTPKIQMGTISATDWEFYTNSVKRIILNSSGDILPATTATTNLGSAAYRFLGIYPTTIHFRNAQNSDSPSGSILDIPSHLAHPTSGWYHNQIYTLSQDYYYDYEGNVADKNGFYLLSYYDEDPLSYNYIPDSTEIQDMVSKRLNYNAVTAEQEVSSDSIDFSNTGTIHSHLVSDEQDITLYFKNFGPGLTQKVVIDIGTGNSITVSAPTGVKKYWSNDTEIAITASGKYIMWFSYLDTDEVQIDWNYYGPIQ